MASLLLILLILTIAFSLIKWKKIILLLVFLETCSLLMLRLFFIRGLLTGLVLIVIGFLVGESLILLRV